MKRSGKERDKVERIIKVYQNPKGKAFKTLFDFIKESFYDKEFCVEDLPDVNEAFVKEVDQAMKKSKIIWLGPGADDQAKIEVLVEMSRAGLLSYRRVLEEVKAPNMPPVEKVVYTLTESGKQTRVIFGE